MDSGNRVHKARHSAGTIAAAVGFGLLAAGFIITATWQSGRTIASAKLSGTIVAKEFRAPEAPDAQITLGRDGSLSSGTAEGEFLLTVEVPDPAGGKAKTFTVWMPNRAQFEALKVGDRFDVGPFLVPK